MDQRSNKQSSKKTDAVSTAKTGEKREESTMKGKENRIALPEELHSALQQALATPKNSATTSTTTKKQATTIKKKLPPAPAPTPAPSPARRSARSKPSSEPGSGSKSLYHQFQHIVQQSSQPDTKPKSVYKQFRDIAETGQV